MKNAIAIVLAITATVAWAGNESACYSIQNNDQRNYCRAQVSKDANTCYAIQNNDQRNYCVATVRQDSNQCFAIQDNQLRQQCRALTQ